MIESLILSLTIKPKSIWMVSPAVAIIPTNGLMKLKRSAKPATICKTPVIFRCVSLNLKRRNSCFILLENKQPYP